MKSDQQLNTLKPVIDGAENILIALSAQPSNDDLAAGLALFLSLQEVGKQVSIVSEGEIKVGHTNLFGIDKVQGSLSGGSEGNLTIILGGVVDSAVNKPTTLKELNWHPEGSDLHLVFNPLPGQKFEPTHITPTYEGAGFSLIFIIGAPNLENLGSIYSQNTDTFSKAHLVNVDNKVANTQFGTTNLVDTQASSVSEIVGVALPGLSLPSSNDIATNILAGIFDATSNLQIGNVTADTYMVVAQSIKSGGKKPAGASNPQASQVVVQANPTPASTSLPSNMSFDNPSATAANPSNPPQDVQSSPEELPSGEGTVTPESDWLTPKIYKGSSLG